jgi:DNA mismatch repair ATPase MutS
MSPSFDRTSTPHSEYIGSERAGSPPPRAANVHFQDHMEEGAIAFDYRLRPGVVEKSNALELMRAVGLDV